jgi:hypothetical protein
MASHEDTVAYGATFEAYCDSLENMWADSRDLTEDPYAYNRFGQLRSELRDQGYSDLDMQEFVVRACREYNAMQEDLQQGVKAL